jgi:hypothetical protein
MNQIYPRDNHELLIPIVLGVTGHQDLRPDDIPILQQRIRSIISDLREQYSHSSLVLLSPLAEGADRLVARVAIECGLQLIVPLPMDTEEYKKDFHGDESKKEFDTLLKSAKEVFVIPADSNNQQLEASRDLSYSGVGLYVAHHSHILIALWDGKENFLHGGTSMVVNNKLNGVPDPLTASAVGMETIESGPVVQIVTPRIQNGIPPSEKYEVIKHYPPFWGDSVKAERTYEAIFSRIDKYNEDIIRHGSLVTTVVTEHTKEGREQISSHNADSWLSSIRVRYAIADALAALFKARRTTTIIGLLTLIIIAFFFFHYYHDFNHHPMILLTYPVLLGICTLWYFHAKSKEYESKHEDYRAFAEAMRIQYFWKSIDIQENVADYYLRKHRGELEWIRYALRPPFSQKKQTMSKTFFTSEFKTVIDTWIRGQYEWYKNRTVENHRRHTHLEKTANIFFLLGFLLSLIMLGDNVLGYHTFPITEYFPISILMALALSGIIHGYNEKMVFSEESKQYDRMAMYFKLALSQLEKLDPHEYKTKGITIMTELGKEALTENGDWLLLHRSRPLEIPRI